MERVTKAKVLGAQDGKAGPLITCGVRFMAWGEETGGTVSLVEHPIPPRTLAAPLHLHEREDEYSYVVEGRVGAWADGEVVYGEPGDLIFKPRNQWHTFWNDGDEPARLIEVISPAGFEHFFDELVDLPRDSDGLPAPEALGQLAERYGLAFDMEGTERIRAEFDLRLDPLPVAAGRA
jgi:mannose-6-phosphate isomerase-like protein (cupin superfamily)